MRNTDIVFILRYHWCAAWGKVSKVWPAKPQLFYLHVVLGAVSDYKWATYVHGQNAILYHSPAPRIQTGLSKLQVIGTAGSSTAEGKLFAEYFFQSEHDIVSTMWLLHIVRLNGTVGVTSIIFWSLRVSVLGGHPKAIKFRVFMPLKNNTATWSSLETTEVTK